MSKSAYWVVVVGLCLVALFTRLYQLGSIPTAIYWDEAAILADARSISETGKDIHSNSWFQAIYPSYGDYKLPILIWLAAISVSLFGVSEWALRLVGVLAGMSTILVTVLLIRELAKSIYPKRYLNESFVRILTVATVLVVGTSFWSIHFSRVAFEGHIGQVSVGLSALLALEARRNKWLYLAAALVGVVAVYTYYSIRFVWPVVFLATVALPYLNLINFQNFPCTLVKVRNKTRAAFLRTLMVVLAMGLFFILLLPMIRSPHYAASQQFRLSAASILQREPQILEANKLRELSGNTILDRVFFHRDLLTAKLLLTHYSKHLSFEYLFVSGDENLRHGTHAHGLFALILVIPFLLGLYILARDRLSVLLFLLLWWLVSLLPASVPFDVPHALRSLNALIPISLIISFGMVPLFTPRTFLRKIFSVVLLLIFCIQFGQFWQYYITIYPSQSSHAWQGGYRELAQKVIEQKNEYLEVWVAVPDNRAFLWFLYPPFSSPQQVQALEKKNFEVQKIENIVFHTYDFVTVRNEHHSVLVVNEAALLEDDIQRLSLTPQFTEYFSDATGTRKYMLAGFKK